MYVSSQDLGNMNLDKNTQGIHTTKFPISQTLNLPCQPWYEKKVKWVNMDQFVYFDDVVSWHLVDTNLEKITMCHFFILMACPSGPTICEILAIP